MPDKKEVPQDYPKADIGRIPFDDALRKILGAPPAPKVKPKPKKEKKTGS